MALISILILEPKYLLSDQTASTLDSHHANLVVEYLMSLKSQGVGINMIHSMTFAKKLANLDSVCIIESGKAIILNNPKTNKLIEYLKYC